MKLSLNPLFPRSKEKRFSRLNEERISSSASVLFECPSWILLQEFDGRLGNIEQRPRTRRIGRAGGRPVVSRKTKMPNRYLGRWCWVRPGRDSRFRLSNSCENIDSGSRSTISRSNFQTCKSINFTKWDRTSPSTSVVALLELNFSFFFKFPGFQKSVGKR